MIQKWGGKFEKTWLNMTLEILHGRWGKAILTDWRKTFENSMYIWEIPLLDGAGYHSNFLDYTSPFYCQESINVIITPPITLDKFWGFNKSVFPGKFTPPCLVPVRKNYTIFYTTYSQGINWRNRFHFGSTRKYWGIDCVVLEGQSQHLEHYIAQVVTSRLPLGKGHRGACKKFCAFLEVPDCLVPMFSFHISGGHSFVLGSGVDVQIATGTHKDTESFRRII